MKQQITSKATSAQNSIILLSAICLVIVAIYGLGTNAMNMVDQLETQSGKPSLTLAVIESPEVTVRVLENLLRSILYSASVDMQNSQR